MSNDPKIPHFPTALRKMWSGGEVQKWIDENIAPVVEAGVEQHVKAREAQPTGTGYTVEPHGDGYAIYQGRDSTHHGLNLGHLTECTPEFAKQIETALSVQPAASAEPVVMSSGWKLVPAVLTEEMHEAAVRTIIKCRGNDDFPPRVYAAMLAAAPVAAQPSVPDRWNPAMSDEMPREDLAWMIVQEACETEPADPDDNDTITIKHLDLKSAVLAAFLRYDTTSPTPPAVASLICPKCGVDRYKVACPSDLMNCPIRGEAQSAVEQLGVDPCPQCTPGGYCATATCGRRAQMQPSAPPCGDAAYEALRELVRLKDIKDRINRSQTVTSFEVDDYQRNKPKAWEAARRAVARQQDSVGSIVASAYRLVEDARKSGMLVRIDLVPRQPLAMGNLDMIVDVRPARPVAKGAA